MEEFCPEAVQDQSIPMVVVGTDVVNLYPSLVIKEVVKSSAEQVL